MPGAGAGDSIAGTDVSDTLSYGDHGSGAAITGGTRLIHAAADRGQGRRHAITANFVPDLPHQVGTHSGFLQQILPGELSRSPLGPNRDQRCGSADQYATRKQFRSGYVDHFDLAAADLLEKLFHIVFLSSLMESRAPPPGWTGAAPVSPLCVASAIVRWLALPLSVCSGARLT